MPLYNILNISVPREFLSWSFRREKKTPLVSVTFSYSSEDDVRICLIAATEETQFNIEWNRRFKEYVNEVVNEHVKSLFSFERVFDVDEVLK